MKKIILSTVAFILIFLVTCPLVSPAFAELGPPTITVDVQTADGFSDLVFTATRNGFGVSGIDVNVTTPEGSLNKPLLNGTTGPDGICVFGDVPAGTYLWRVSEGLPESDTKDVPLQSIHLSEEELYAIQLLSISWMGEDTQKARAFYENLARLVGYDLSQHAFPSSEGRTLLDFSMEQFRWLQGLEDRMSSLSTGLPEIDVLKPAVSASKIVAEKMFDRASKHFQLTEITVTEFTLVGVVNTPDVDYVIVYKRLDVTIFSETIVRAPKSYAAFGCVTGLLGIFLSSYDLYSGFFNPQSEWRLAFQSGDGVTQIKTVLEITDNFVDIVEGTLTLYEMIRAASTAGLPEATKLSLDTLNGALSVVGNIIVVLVTALKLAQKYPRWGLFMRDLLNLKFSLLVNLAIMGVGIAAGVWGLYLLATGGAASSSIAGIVIGAVLVALGLIASYLEYGDAILNLRGELGKTLTGLFQMREGLWKIDTNALHEGAAGQLKLANTLNKLSLLPQAPEDIKQFFEYANTQLTEYSACQEKLAHSVDEAKPIFDDWLRQYLSWDGWYDNWIGWPTEGKVRAHLEAYNCTSANYETPSRSFVNNAVLGVSAGNEYWYQGKYVTSGNLDGTTSFHPYSDVADVTLLNLIKNGWAFEPTVENDGEENEYAVTYNFNTNTKQGTLFYDPKPGYLSVGDAYPTKKGDVLVTSYQYKFFFDHETSESLGQPIKECLEAWQTDIQNDYNVMVKPILERVESLMKKLTYMYDVTPPTTTCTIIPLSLPDASGKIHVTSSTIFALYAHDDQGGTGVAATGYRIYNEAYDSGWAGQSAFPAILLLAKAVFRVPGFLANGQIQIDYNSTDLAGNIEPTHTIVAILENPPADPWMGIMEPTTERPAKARDPSQPDPINVAVFSRYTIDNIVVKVGEIECPYQIIDHWTVVVNLYVLRVETPPQQSQGTYDLEVTATYKGITYSDVEHDAVEYASAPSTEPIEKGLAWLRTRQYGDGSWLSNVGVTSLATLAFLNAGYDETDATVSKAISYILSKVHSDGSIYISYSVYETSTAILPLVATHNANYVTIIENAKNWLVGAQQDETFGYTPTNYQYGGWTYSSARGDPDLSNTQFALLALDAANLPKTDPAWSKAIMFTQRCQNRPASNDQAWAHVITQPSYNDGGFIYRPSGWSLAGGTLSYGSMTGAGIWGLLLSGVPKTEERVVAALDWVANHYTWDNNPVYGSRPYYYYLSMSKALTMYREPVINGHDWYQELYDKIVGMQIDAGSGKGYWSTPAEDYNPILTTAYAILSLQTRAAALPVQRLSYLTFILRSNCLIRVIDPDGNLVGYNYMTGLGENQIPTAVYSGPFSEPQYIVIVNPKPGTYKLELVGISEGPYSLTIQGNYGDEVTKTFEYTGEVKPGELDGSQLTVTAIVGPIDIYASQPQFEKITDNIPPATILTIGNPQYTDGAGKKHITSATSLTLTAEDNIGGTGVASTHYRIYNTTSYDTGLITSTPPIEFHLTGIDDGEYSIDFYSVDNIGNVESTTTQTVILDNTAPSLTIETPLQYAAVQDGVDFTISATDLSGVASVMISIRSAQGNVLSSQFELMPANLKQDGKWHLYFDTRQLPDGFYSFVANGTDVLGNWGTKTVKFSIRNWATIQLLPSTPNSNAGRTMPIKFSIRVKASVDPAQPFIYNEELTIKICRIASPSNILLQTSIFGSGSTNYRIDTGKLYITNFKTLNAPATYIINIYRKGMLIGSFRFSTVKQQNPI
jgi:squalene-hopene/tetraprenyl-beta-curcumene cyclase